MDEKIKVIGMITSEKLTSNDVESLLKWCEEHGVELNGNYTTKNGNTEFVFSIKDK